MKTKLTSLTLAAAFLALLCATSVSLQAATITVTTTNDSGAGSLRTALVGAANGDTINFSVTGTITLTNGQLNVSNSVSLLGPGPGTLTVSGNHASRVFSVTGTNVTFSGLTIANGQSGINNGGGICLNSGVTMTVSNCIVSGNCATNYDEGGGIYNYYGNLTVVGSTMSGNSAWWGGGIYNYYGNLTVVDSTLTGNSAFNSGGAIYSANMLTVIHSALSGNSATNWGGGIVNDGSSGSANLTITNSTLSGNSAGCGGGIYNGGEFGSVTLTIANTTISSNLASSFGAGIYNDGSSYGMAALTITNTTVGGNWAGTNGGGICNDGSSYGTGMVMVATSVIRANAANNSGGGIMNDGSTGSALLTITGSTVSTNSAYLGAGVFSDGQSGSAKLTNNASTFSGNSASYGGGIYNFAGGAGGSVTLTINASTFSGNGATYQGGGIYNDGQSSGNATLTINASTFSGNWATNGGGSIYNYGILGGNARLEIGDTILNAAAGVSITNVQGTVKSDGFNLSNDAGGGCLTNATDHINISNLLLGPLQDNGGPTWTHALLPGSPAIDQGKRNAVTNLVWTTDQRGLTRPVDFLTVPNAPGGDGSDIGAFELQYSPVVSTADNGPGTLRNALADVANGGTITFGVAGTITLTNGQLNVSNSVTLLGPGPGALTVSGNNASGVFNITGTNVTISGLTITNGNTSLNGAGINAGGAPGSTLAIDNCVVVSNLTTSAGGGGGIYNSPGVTMTISNCTLSLNRASSGFGGGIFNDRATLIVVGSTLSANYGTLGGGIGNNGSAGTAILMVKATTLSGNSSYLGGGGILNWGQSGSATLTINASTFSGNSATGSGGGSICNNGSLGTGRVEVADCILSAGAVGGNIYNYQGTVTSAGYNLSSDNGGGFLTATGDQINTNPLLGPLQNNGGPTWTCALLPGSPAIDKGKTNAIPGLACSTDQRGFPRPCDNPNLANAPGGDGSDIGAYEAQYIVVSNAADSGPGSLRAAVANYVSGDSIAFAPSLSGATILLTSGQITLNQSLTIDASALPGGITINGNQASRIFQVGGGVTVVLNSLTITNGTDTGGGNAGGGGILSYGTLTLNNCTLAGNSANQSTWGGGGILSYHGTLTINQSTLSGNSANNGTSGGGIITYSGTLTINQSTVSGNSAAGNGGGIRNGGTTTVNNSIVAGNSPDNISGSFTGANNLTSGDPLLAPLGNYGGTTPTMPPLPGSPAIDNGSDSATNIFATDQRGVGFPRLAGLHVDIGAVESAYAPAAPLVVTQPATGATPTAATLNATVNPNGAVTAYYFGYGLTTNYGIVTATNTLSTGAAAVNANLTGLPPATVYHFRAVATNSLGSTFGGDLTFHTAGLTNLVTNANDSGPGSLRATVANCVSGDSIAFDASLSGATILLTSGQITLGQSLTIDASALPGGITINGNHASRIFQVGGGVTVVLNSLTITNGIDTGGGNAGGGGILSYGTLTLNNCTLAGNSASQLGGGGIWNEEGTLTVNESTLQGNNANNSLGGGGLVNDGGTVTVNQSTLTGNSATNTTYGGGGILDAGSLTIYNSIIAGNTATTSPEIYMFSGTLSTLGNNLTNGVPLLAPLGNYGGPTPTMPPLPGSPAIDGCTNGTVFTTDQRGFPRVVGPFADIGAVESGNPIPCLMVNTAVDKNDGLGTDGASLRDAVAYAPSGSTIIFAPALSGVTIVLTNGQLNVPNSVTILGPGPGALTVSGNNASGVFNVTGTNVTISGLTIANGSADYGAGIYAGGDAGSIVTINNCVLTNNSATGNGGGVYTISGVTMTISHCTFSGNNAPAGSGGGIYNDGTSGSSAAVTISASTFSGNSAGFGGGIYSDGSQGGSVALTISASTFSGNSATFTGGGIYNCGFFGNATLTISASTFSGNSASAAAGGIYNLGSSGNATLEIGDTILNTGSSGENIVNASGTVTSDGYNLSSDNGGSFLNATGDQINTDPKLGPLQDNGGPTRTHALLAGSPTIDAGADSVTNFLATDQRGYPRCSGAHVDIGAVEAQWAPANHPPRLSNSAWTAPGGARCFQCTFSSVTNADFTVLATTNLALPLPDWTMLAPAIQYSPGQYQFTDPGATNYPQRFYRVVSP